MFPNENKPSSEEGINISKRQASTLVALFLFLSLSVFIVGYWLGKKSMLDSLTDSFEKEIEKFDQASETVASLEGAPDASAINQDFAFDNSPQDSPQADTKPVALEVSLPQPVKKELVNQDVTVESKDTKEVLVKAFAQLIGFGGKQAAMAFKQRLEAKGVEIIIETKSSKTSKGKSRVWYQAITPTFNSLEELDRMVKKIQKSEFIKTKDINIVRVKEQKDKV